MTDTVVATIAGIAASAVPGVHRLGGPAGRVDHGVTVVVGEREAAVTVEVTVEFGACAEEVASGVRHQVATAVVRMTDLRVREVDVRVVDVHVPGSDLR